MIWLGFILFGAVSGWITGLIIKGRGYGLLGNIVVGIAGGLVGGFLGGLLGLTLLVGLVGTMLACILGAIGLLCLLSTFAPRP